MASKKIQIGIRVTEDLHRRIEEGCISRDLSVQDLITAGVELYLETPPNFEYMAASYLMADSGDGKKRLAELSSWTNLWQRYITEMPHAKAKQMAELMKLDLLHYKSSRRKK